MELSKKIKALRFRSGLTQEQLADKLGISAQSVSKWENSVAMPDITLLPELAEIFGVSIDDLFDLTSEQRMNRIESRLDIEDELPADIYREYGDFLEGMRSAPEYKKRAVSLLAYLHWHRMNAEAEKVRRYAKEAIELSPGEKGCQWMLQKADGHAVWDWNMANHSKAIEFYREIVDQNPDVCLPYTYLLDNLIADNRTDEAEKYLEKYGGLDGSNPIIVEVYRAYIALCRQDMQSADGIIEELGKKYRSDSIYLFEAAQYYARKCDYDRAIGLYERDFEIDPRRPRFIDSLMSVSLIYEIKGDYKNAAKTYDRIVELLRDEWGMTEEVEYKDAIRERDRLLAKVK